MPLKKFGFVVWLIIHGIARKYFDKINQIYYSRVVYHSFYCFDQVPFTKGKAQFCTIPFWSAKDNGILRCEWCPLVQWHWTCIVEIRFRWNAFSIYLSLGFPSNFLFISLYLYSLIQSFSLGENGKLKLVFTSNNTQNDTDLATMDAIFKWFHSPVL